MLDAFATTWIVRKPVLRSKGGIVVAQNRKAASVGAAVLEAGGNAVDATVATAMALAAVEPWMSGLGGGGCMLVWPADAPEPTAIDFGMVAPERLEPADYPLTGAIAADLFGWPAVLDDRNLHGPLAICTPTQLAGIGLAYDRFGTMPWAGLVAPAVELARAGLELDWFASLVIGNAARELAGNEAARSIWLPGGFPPRLAPDGEPIFLPLGRLADTLGQVAAEGPLTLYQGAVGEALLRDIEAVGGRLASDDLAAYTPRGLTPLTAEHNGARLFAMPGLFAGATFVRCLEQLGSRAIDRGLDAAAYLAFAEALRSAYAERLETMGAGTTAPSCTSHFCIVDRAGTIVTVTQTLLSLFGSKVVSPSTGILLNNGVMWFDPRPDRPNSLAPGKRPLSNMCPVLGEHRSRRFGLGASGGRRILPAVLQLIAFLVDHGLDLEEAFHTPRIDASGGETVVVNPALPAAVRAALRDRYPVREARPAVYPTIYACPSAVLRELGTGLNEAAAEPILPWAGPVAEREGIDAPAMVADAEGRLG